MKYLLALLVSLGISIQIQAQAPVIWGPNSSVQALTTRGLLVGNKLVTNTNNYVTNPNAFKGTTGATTTGTSVTATRNTSSPIQAPSDWSVNLKATSTNNVAFTLDTLDPIVQTTSQNCQFSGIFTASLGTGSPEVRFRVLNSGNVVGYYAFISSQSAAIPFSIGVNCASSATVDVYLQTAGGTDSTLKLSNLYYGLATNQANVSQATVYGSAKWATTANCSWVNSAGVASPGNFSADTDCPTPSVTGFASAPATKIPAITFANGLPIGFYTFCTQGDIETQGSATTGVQGSLRFSDGTNNGSVSQPLNAGASGNIQTSAGGFCSFLNVTTAITASSTFNLQAGSSGTGSQIDARTFPLEIQVTRYPASSQLAVIPNSQNVYAAGKFFSTTGNSKNITAGTKTVYNDATLFNSNNTFYGSAQVASSTCGAATNDFGICVPSLPAGTYRVTALADFNSQAAAAGTETTCAYDVYDGTNVIGTAQTNTFPSVGNEQTDYISSISGVITYSSIQTNIRFVARAVREGGGGNCSMSTSNSANSERYAQIIVEPISQRNVQPVFLQSPTQASQTGTAIATGKVGEEIRSYQSSFQATNTSTWINVTSISLTPGVWDISGLCTQDNNATQTGMSCYLSAFSGNTTTDLAYGDNALPITVAAGVGGSISIPQWRQTVTGTTTYYLKSISNTANGSTRGRISAVRLGD